MKKKKTTIVSSKDVAKLAGVSQSTVSRVFSDKAEMISSKTKEKVAKAAKELGYRPNSIARSLSTRMTRIIGIEINDFNNAYYMQALGMFSRAFHGKGYQLMILSGDKDQGIETRLKSALEYHVDGVIMTNAVLDSDYLKWCNKYRIPIFMFNRINHENHRFNSVIGDNYQGGYDIGKLMVDHGYGHVAYIAGDDNAYTNLKREAGFIAGLGDAPISVSKIKGTFSYESGYQAALKMIKSKASLGEYAEVEAVFCASDSIALGFIDGIRHGSDINIPEDLSVVGFDGIDEGENINYRLTTYQQPLQEVVDATVEGMVKLVETGEDQPVRLVIQGKLLQRESFRMKGSCHER